MNKNSAVIVDITRTPFGKAIRGSFAHIRSDDLMAQVIKNLTKNISQESIDDLILGCGFPESHQGINVARICGIRSGLPYSVPAMTINRFCASGLESMVLCANKITTGQIKTGLAGGLETMSLIPMTGCDPQLNPTLVKEHPEIYFSMGLTAENIASKYEILRQDQDEFALKSHSKAIAAQKSGRFSAEITPISFTKKVLSSSKIQEEVIILEKDECPRANTTLEMMGKLPPAFKIKGGVTAGNTSPLTDGAACSLMMSLEEAEAQNKTPLATIIDYMVVGLEPALMGMGPVGAISKLLERNNLSVADIDLFEVNEAFAVQVLAIQKELNIPDEKLNVNGGAIALGHPLGASGTRLVGTMIRELKLRNSKLGIVSMCIGGGMGAAALIKNIS